MRYKLFHKVTGEFLGKASTVESLGEHFLDLFYDHGIFPHEVRIEEASESDD